MFAYCNNNPVNAIDPSGQALVSVSVSFYDDPTLSMFFGGGGGGCSAIGYIVGAGISLWPLSEARKQKPVNLPSPKKLTLDLEHISSGHMPGGNRNPDGNKTVFWGMTIDQVIKAIYEAYQYSSKLQTQGDRIKVIGYSETYNILIEMWINVVTYIIETAYPIG